MFGAVIVMFGAAAKTGWQWVAWRRHHAKLIADVSRPLPSTKLAAVERILLFSLADRRTVG